jgi:hypothetical protein
MDMQIKMTARDKRHFYVLLFNLCKKIIQKNFFNYTLTLNYCFN